MENFNKAVGQHSELILTLQRLAPNLDEETRRIVEVRSPVIVIAGSGIVISDSADADHPSERSDDSRRLPADQARV
jgi:vacuolar-type H+-ATPase subunit F/Vma7